MAYVQKDSQGGSLSFTTSKAYAGDEEGDPKYDWSWPPCTGTRICNGQSVEYNGIKLKCIAGTFVQNCTDDIYCTPNGPCPMG